MTADAPPVTDRCFQPADFPPARLAAERRAAGLTVSVVVPARDEAATVGRVVARLRRLGMQEAELVDEVVVVDGGSQDDTAAVASGAGARVVQQSAVLPEAGDAPGKGEALWKGLAATTGKLVVFVDADVTALGDGLLCGVLGPLVHHPELALVKAAYERPLVLGDEPLPGEGGRVTELVARPLLATFWPELADLVQPLAGECAGRRSVLEGLPFVQGYGVELAMLIDLLREHGRGAIAQVDLGTRTHHHQSLSALGRMATELLHVAVERLRAAGRLALADEPARALPQPVRGAEGRWDTLETTVEVRERPPLADWGPVPTR